MRKQGGPFFLECKTYRWLEHVGPYFDHELNRTYRTKQELEGWMHKCPVKQSGKYLVESGAATAEELLSWEQEIQQTIDEDIVRAYQDPWPDPNTLIENVY